MSGQVSRGAAGEDQADERAGVGGVSWRGESGWGGRESEGRGRFVVLRWRGSGRWPGRCAVAHLAGIRQMSRQVSRGSVGEYQADERAGVARLSWRVSGR